MTNRLVCVSTFSYHVKPRLICYIDRDPQRWNLSPQVRDRRRRVFWSLFGLDNYRVCLSRLERIKLKLPYNNLQALTCGRPPMISLDSIDVEYPEGSTVSDTVSSDPSQGRK